MSPVSLRPLDGGAEIVISNPPVNALSQAVRIGLDATLRQAFADPAVEFVVLRCDGRTFVAGADIAEFDGPLLPPDLNDINGLIESAAKPVVAALHGTVLGGGLELALSCHGRIAAAGTRLGLPEVHLGLLPGAGGTRRLPRAAGLAAALDMILSGNPIDAAKAQSLGVIEAVADNPPAAAAALAKSLVGKPLDDRRLGTRPVDPSGTADALAAARARIAKEWPWSGARLAALESVEQGLSGPLDTALAQERALFERCRTADEGQALIHQFFAERAAVKPPVPDGTPGREVNRVGIVGAGTMGRGIAMVFAAAGLPTRVFEQDAAARDRARAAVDGHFQSQADRGRISAEAAERARAAVVMADDLAALGDCDLIVEAAFEQVAVKREVFAALDRIAKPGAVLATNTSSIDVAAIAAATTRPGDVLGMHFFSPAQVMRLLEIVRTPLTEPSAVRAAADIARRTGKTGIVVGNCFGFVANRMIFEYLRQAEFLVEEGAAPEQVDRAIVEFGLPMGPFAMCDMAGNDVGWMLRKDRAHLQPTDKRATRIADLICERGWFGQKSGQGWFRYEAGNRKPLPNPEIEPLLVAERRRLGLTPRPIGDDEIVDRCIGALVNEAAHILDEGLAARPGDIDVIYVQGFGFPRWRGGPLHWADRRGIGKLHDRLKGWFEAGDRWLEPAPLLGRMAAAGIGFGELEKKGWLKK